MGTGVKRPGREAGHSPPASAEVKKMWIYTSTPLIRFHGVVLNALSFTFYSSDEVANTEHAPQDIRNEVEKELEIYERRN
jgi:hypothetical protein